MLELQQLEIVHTSWIKQGEYTTAAQDLQHFTAHAATASDIPQRKGWWLVPVTLLTAILALPVIAVLSMPA